MKRMLLPPIFVLAALLAFSLWNIRHMEGETDRWREQLQAADRLALSGEWAEALGALWDQLRLIAEMEALNIRNVL